MGARVGITFKVKGLGQKKPHFEFKSGPSHSHDLGKFVEHVQLIDRGNNWYYEKVTDSEPHGHGTDKIKPN